VFTDPDVSPDSRYIAFAGMIPSTAPTIADSFDIFIYDTQDQSRRRITAAHTNHRNTFPTWSTNQLWLTYISDRSARNVWDLYGSPATGGVVDDAQASVVRLSNTGGTLVAGNPGGFDKPLMTWNPVSPVLAIVGGEALFFVTTTQSGATQIEVPISNPPVDMQWSPDGALLAASTGATVMTIALDGTSTPRVSRSGDTFADLAWTGDGNWLLYRATRGGSSWLEAYDLDQSQLPAPIAISGAEPHTVGARSLGEYRLNMSMSPAVGTTLLFYPAFTGSPTIGIKSLDISGLSP
jgi:Tol biopolymer transport system component